MKKKSLGLITALCLLGTNLLSAEEGITAPGRDQGMWQTLTMIGIAVLFFYFILWRPEQKRRKALDAVRNSLKKGDKVIALGILGTVHQIKDQTVILSMCDGSKIEVLRGAINEVTPEPEETTDTSSNQI